MKYGLIGTTLTQSFSPLIHSLLGDYPYELCTLKEEELDGFLKKKDFLAVNVTRPFKERALPCCDLLTDHAKAAGSVNLLYKMTDGGILGENTDYTALLALLSDPELGWEGEEVVILGSGGTSRTAAAAAKALGAERVTIVSRKGPFDYEALRRDYADREFLLINTTPVGMTPGNRETPLDLEEFSGCIGVLDVVYNPIRSRLVETADELGLPAIGGLKMLVWQAAAAAPYFGGREREDWEVEELCQTVLSRLQNIVLIGMPGAGKTTVGEILAKRMERPFYDSDRLFEEKSGLSPELFIRCHGEERFRQEEAALLRELSRKTGSVIATGGGAVLTPGTMEALRQNGVIFWLRRPPEELEPHETPLGELNALYEERAPYYDLESDFSADNTGTPEDAAEEIRGIFLA